MAIQISSETSLLFIGDSITDCGQRQDKEGIGSGYVRIIRDWLRAKDPAGAPTILNRGISGHKVTDLKERWERDVIASSPDVLSIKIGINDVWHGLGGRDNGVSIDDYRAVYRELLQQVRDSVPGCRLVLCEPSVIWPPQPEEGNTLLRPYVQAVHEMGEQFGADCIVPLHDTFNQAKAARPDIDWAPDGVHPSSSGHMLIARAWLSATGLL